MHTDTKILPLQIGIKVMGSQCELSSGIAGISSLISSYYKMIRDIKNYLEMSEIIQGCQKLH